MFGKNFRLNEETLSTIEQFGQHMPGGFFIYKAAQPEELLYVNQAVIDIFGCEDLEDFKHLTGFVFRGMLHPEDYARVSSSIDDQIDASEDHMDYVEYRIIRRDGSIRWVDDYGHYTETEAYGGIYYVFISDITEKKESAVRDAERVKEQLLEEEKLRNEQRKLITALASDYWSVYYIELDQDRALCYQSHPDIDNGMNVGDERPYMETFLHYADRYVTDQYREEFIQFIQPAAIRAGLKTARVISYRYMVNRNGHESYEMIRFAGVRHPEDREDHQVHSIGACFTDVDAETRRTLAQSQALSDALAVAEEASKAKTAFLSNMSHEIRTPMNAIIGLNNIAMNDPETPEKTKEYLMKMDLSAHHLMNIINDILDISRIESGRMSIRNEEFSFSKMLEQVNTIISGQCNEKGLNYDCRIQGRVDDYYIGDDMKLRQVLISILGNAVKFTPKGGTISFIVREVTRYEGRVTLNFEMRDNGIGMSREFLPHIFENFAQEDSSSTNRYGSTGLGLSITKNIVELMNGQITVESEKGKGTTFHVTLTFAESDRKVARDSEENLIPNHKLCVLVIDDDPVACEHAALVLGQVGISCESALSGEAGYELVKMHHARMEPYDLILVDWKMPGMDGLETTRRIRQLVGGEMAIIILTSYNWDEIMDQAKEAGVDSFAAKPLFAGTVLDEFREAFRRRNETAAKRTKDITGAHLLLAEDMRINAEIMCMILRSREIMVDVAENGRVALEMFMESPENTYDAILMDMRMPEMDGLEAARAIRMLDRPDAKRVPIIALTANAFDEDVQRSMQSGLNAHLSKPVEPAVLFETLENLI